MGEHTNLKQQARMTKQTAVRKPEQRDLEEKIRLASQGCKSCYRRLTIEFPQDGAHGRRINGKEVVSLKAVNAKQQTTGTKGKRGLGSKSEKARKAYLGVTVVPHHTGHIYGWRHVVIGHWKANF